MKCGAGCACCRGPEGVDAANGARSGSGAMNASQRTMKTSASSLTTLLGHRSPTFRDGTETPVDDPETHYGSASAKREPEEKKKFDPTIFKKRVGDHLAAMKALEDKEREKEGKRPVVETEEDVAEREKREARDNRRLERIKHKEEVRTRAAELRSAQRRCWGILVLVVLALIVGLGELFGRSPSFGERLRGASPATTPSSAVAPVAEPSAAHPESVTLSSRDQSELESSSEWDGEYDRDEPGEALSKDFADDSDPGGEAKDVAETDEFDLDFNDPRMRTIAPKAWRRRQRELDRIKQDARRSAKDDVERWVKGAHKVAGVGETESENEYDEKLIERVEVSPGVVVERRAKDGKGSDAAEVLRKSQASILSHGLIEDTANSARYLDALAKGVDDESGAKQGVPADLATDAKTEATTAVAGSTAAGSAAAGSATAGSERASAAEGAVDLSKLFSSREEPVVHERQPDPEATFSLAPRRALV